VESRTDNQKMMFNCLQFTASILVLCLLSPPAEAQLLQGTVCPPVQQMKAPQLYGLWAVRFTNPPACLPNTATMLLERHAEFSDSLAGTVSRDFGVLPGAAKAVRRITTAALAGDLEEGILILDESSNNINITGTWNGEMVAGSCGKEFRGNWKDTSSSAPTDAPDVPFTLRKLP
jgi:hypothetical protein